MKKFIRYLYEYQNGKRIQNVGFVKVEQNDDYEVIQIYGKGFPTGGSQEVEVLVFYMAGQQPVGVPMGKIKGTKPMLGYRLEFSAEDVGGKEIFDKINGLILLNDTNGHRRWYAAVWDERPVLIEKMLWQEEMLRQEKEIAQKEAEDFNQVSQESEDVQENVKSDEPAIEEVREEAQEPGAEEKKVEEREMPEMPEMPEKPEVPEMPEMPETEDNPIYKITREDLANLPRREWPLANNNFLLHGYYNYHHLVSFKKDEDCWLGVPGIYHPKEQKAADAFGFGQFMKPDEGEVQLSDDEMSSEEGFGYWCRKVSAVIEK